MRRGLIVSALAVSSLLPGVTWAGREGIQTANVTPAVYTVDSGRAEIVPVVVRRRRVRRVVVKRRSKKKSAAIVGGTAATGAAIGALAGGGKGAAIGAIAGGGSGFVYDRATHKKTRVVER